MSTTKHLKPRSRVEVNVNESVTCLDVCRWSSSWSVLSIFELTSDVNLFQWKQITAYQLVRKKHSFSSLSKFSNFHVLLFWSDNPKKFWQSVEVVYYCGINDLHFGADVEVPNADPQAVSPLCLAEMRRVGVMKPLIIIFMLFVICIFVFWGNPWWQPGFCFSFILDDLLEVGLAG